MAGVNKMVVLGRVGNIEHSSQNSKSITNLSIATSEKWTDKQGKVQERTEWHKWVAFGKIADTMAKYVTKGSQLYLEGKSQTRMVEKDNKKSYYQSFIVENFQFCGSAGKKSEPNQSHFEAEQDEMESQVEPRLDDSDDIPF